ncbi:MAG: S8 family serine peptidase [Chloroflexi bacterium]|nr:S8 family serine peptidase [Chloroflexota bacterium]
MLVFREELDASAPSSADGDVIAGRYIVLLEPGADPDQAAQDFDVDVRGLYRSAVSGFSAEMTAERAAQIAQAPSVALVQPVRRLRIALHANPFQTLIEGVDRIDGEENGAAGIGLPPGPAVNADIAIIDTGIDLDHPDLNVMGGFGAYETLTGFDEDGNPIFECSTGFSIDDDHGHGTHVAGTAAAIDNEIGVVGTAPGARLWAVRVRGEDGFGCDDDVLMGVDWVTERKMEFDDGAGDGDAGINFTVANMSLGGDPSPALCLGIANSVAQGVMYAVAAGNDTADASISGPANCADVVTVSAFADYDGLPGGLASQTCAWTGFAQPDPDDSFAWFSNFGPLVEIAAPGVCVMSTFPVGPSGAYAVLNGTSMATPHVAGALALFKTFTGYGGPYDSASVMTALTAAGWTRPQNSECGFTEDPDGSPEPMLYMGTSCSAATSQPLAAADINCDREITGSDSLILIRFAANVETTLPPECPPIGALSGSAAAAVPAQLRGDLDCSGAVDAKDALVILRLVGGVAGPTETPCTS